MKEQEDHIENSPPFFKKWKGLYLFVLLFELALIFLFIWITNSVGL